MKQTTFRISSLWRYSGLYLLIVGVMHTCFGCWLGVSVLQEMLSEGLLNSGGMDEEVTRKLSQLYFLDGIANIDQIHGLRRFGTFWFLWSGLAWMAFGLFVHQWVRETSKPPGKLLGVFFFGFGGLALLVYPTSGFWLFMPLALVLWVAKSDPSP